MIKIKKRNSRNKALSIATYDFSAVYTNIPHNKLKNVKRELLNFCFKGSKKQFIAVTKFGAAWTESKNKFNIIFNNCFFSFGNLSFRQITGTPMGSDPAPIMANLFLYYHENK